MSVIVLRLYSVVTIISQTFKNNSDKKGINSFLDILEQLKSFSVINFTWEDIVRSGLVRDYIMTKEWMDIK